MKKYAETENIMENLTFKKLKKALIKLIDKKDYDKISVTDIVKECGFSRQNFYKNFENKDDLVKAIFTADIKTALDREILYHFGKTSVNIIEVLDENKKLYLSVFCSSSSDYLYRLFFEYICTMFKAFAEYSAYRNLSQKQEKSLHFFASGLITMMIRLFSGKEKMSIRDFSDLIYDSVPECLRMFMSEDGVTGDYILYKLEKNLGRRI